MTARANIPQPLSGAMLARAVSDWLKLGAAVEIAPDGTIKIKPQDADKDDNIDLLDFKR